MSANFSDTINCVPTGVGVIFIKVSLTGNSSLNIVEKSYGKLKNNMVKYFVVI